MIAQLLREYFYPLVSLKQHYLRDYTFYSECMKRLIYFSVYFLILDLTL